MPLYEFDVVNGDGAVLSTLSLSLPVAERDRLTLRRRTVPTSVGVLGATADPTRPECQVLGAYRRLEQRHGNTRDFRRRIGHSPAVVKRAWSEEGAGQ